MSPAISLNLIGADDLHSAWQIILPGLRVVQKRSQANWIPEDVYAHLRSQASYLHLAYMDGDYAGFVVLTPMIAWDGKTLHIWAAYGERPGVVDAFFGDVERIARAQGAKRITFWSTRRWDRKIAPFGMTAKQVEFVKEL